MRLRLRKAASLRMGRGTLWRIDATPFGVEHHFAFLPRVVAALQPWAEGLNPFGILAVALRPKRFIGPMPLLAGARRACPEPQPSSRLKPHEL